MNAIVGYDKIIFIENEKKGLLKEK